MEYNDAPKRGGLRRQKGVENTSNIPKKMVTNQVIEENTMIVTNVSSWGYSFPIWLSRTCNMEVKVVPIYRIDTGRSNQSGDYRCGKEGCEWTASSVHRNTPRSHVEKQHPGCKSKLHRLHKRTQSEEERRQKKSIRNKLLYQKKKVKVTGSLYTCSSPLSLAVK